MGGQKMAAASIQRTLAVFAVAACLFGLTSIATAENLFKIPGTNYYISLDAAQPLNTADNQPLLAAIADWLSKEFGLPVIDRFPKVKTIASGEICGLRRWRGNNLPDRGLDRTNARRPIRLGARNGASLPVQARTQT